MDIFPCYLLTGRTMKSKKIFDNLFYSIVVAFSSLISLLPVSPYFMPLTNRDSGVFLYVGWRILSGEIPYKQVWDHKPPIIFYINALGLSITPETRWGVWIIELVFLFTAFIIGFLILKKLFGILPAIFSLITTSLTLAFLIQGGNFTTEYIILFQFIVFWILFFILPKENNFLCWFLIGLVGGLAFFTKQTAIGLWIAVFINLVITAKNIFDKSAVIKNVAAFFSGGLIITLMIIIYFLINGALSDFVDAAFKFNFFYSTTISRVATRLWPIIMGIYPLTKTGLFQFSLIGYSICIVMLIKKVAIFSQRETFFKILLIGLPIELLLIGASGYSHPHYYMTLVPYLFIFSAIILFFIKQQFEVYKISNIYASVFQISVIGIIIWGAFFSYYDQIKAFRGIRQERQMVIDFIVNHTDPDDHVLFWGEETMMNYYTKRNSPTRFVYQTPLYTQGYANEEMVMEYLTDITLNQPKIIVDTENFRIPFLSFLFDSQEINEKLEMIRNNYQSTTVIGSWTIYQREK